MKMREKVKQIAAITMAGAIMTSSVVSAAEVKPADKKSNKPALTVYTEELAKVNKFPERNGKPSFRVVEKEEVLKIDRALQEYIDFALLTRNPDKKKEDIVGNNFSFVARPRAYNYLDGSAAANAAMNQNMITHLLEKDYFGGVEYVPDAITRESSPRTAEERTMKPVEGYDPYKKVSKAQLEKGIQLVSEELGIDLAGVHFVISPYSQSGYNEYLLSDILSKEKDGRKISDKRMVRVVIEANPEGNLLASALTGIGELMLAGVTDYTSYYDDIYKEKDADENMRRMLRGGSKVDGHDYTKNYGEDFKIYAIEKIKGKDQEIDKIIEADKDVFYKTQVKGLEGERKEKEKAITAYFDKVLKNPPEYLKQERQPVVYVDMGKQGVHTLMGREYLAGFRRLATTEDKIVIKVDDSKTKFKIHKVIVNTNKDTDFAYDDIKIRGKEVKRGANKDYTISLPKGKTTVSIEVDKEGIITRYAFDIVRK